MKAGDSANNPIVLPEVFVTAKSKQSTLSSIGSFFWGALDWIPFAGSIKQIGTGIYHGDWKEAGLGVAFLAVDVFTLGEGGEALRLGEKGIQILAKDEVQEIVENRFLRETENKAVQETGYYADEFGNVISKNQDEAFKSLEKGGYEISATRKEGEGTLFKDVTTRSGKKVDVRLMKGGRGGRRAVTNHPGSNSGKTLNGKATAHKADYHLPQY